MRSGEPGGPRWLGGYSLLEEVEVEEGRGRENARDTWQCVAHHDTQGARACVCMHAKACARALVRVCNRPMAPGEMERTQVQRITRLSPTAA